MGYRRWSAAPGSHRSAASIHSGLPMGMAALRGVGSACTFDACVVRGAQFRGGFEQPRSLRRRRVDGLYRAFHGAPRGKGDIGFAPVRHMTSE